MYGVQKQQLRDLSKQEYVALRQLCRLSKNMYNVALYQIRQHFFETGKFLCYEENYKRGKLNENYKLMGSASAQQTMIKVNENFLSFFENKKVSGKKAKIPHYKEKDGFFELAYPQIKLQKDGRFFLPASPSFKKQFGKIHIILPSNLRDKKICEVRILPRYDAAFFEVEYVYKVQEEKPELSLENILSIDLGIDNFASVITTTGASFLLDGKEIKSMNQWYNKRNSDLQSIKDRHGISTLTKQQMRLIDRRNHYMNDFLNKAVRYLITHCMEHQIGRIIVGYNKRWKDSINIGRSNNQKFVGIPHGKFCVKLESMCERYGIECIKQEESYTSKADFLAQDAIPIFEDSSGNTYSFSGKRLKRGIYKSKSGVLVNADINGAANILRKSGYDFDFNYVSKIVKQNPKKVKLTKTRTRKHVRTDLRASS